MEVFYRGECFFPLFVICSRLEKLVLAQKVMRGSMYVRGIHPIKRIQHFLRMLMNLIINRAWTSFHTDCGEKKKKRKEMSVLRITWQGRMAKAIEVMVHVVGQIIWWEGWGYHRVGDDGGGGGGSNYLLPLTPMSLTALLWEHVWHTEQMDKIGVVKMSIRWRAFPFLVLIDFKFLISKRFLPFYVYLIATNVWPLCFRQVMPFIPNNTLHTLFPEFQNDNDKYFREGDSQISKSDKREVASVYSPPTLLPPHHLDADPSSHTAAAGDV